jgi:hypothetical protein
VLLVLVDCLFLSMCFSTWLVWLFLLCRLCGPPCDTSGGCSYCGCVPPLKTLQAPRSARRPVRLNCGFCSTGAAFLSAHCLSALSFRSNWHAACAWQNSDCLRLRVQGRVFSALTSLIRVANTAVDEDVFEVPVVVARVGSPRLERLPQLQISPLHKGLQITYS